MLIYLTRHGKTDLNKEERVSGTNTAQLIEEGIEQANKISEKLKDKKIEKIFSSPFDRAFLTAKIIGEKQNLQVERNEFLKEFDFGNMEGNKMEGETMENLKKRRVDLKFKFPEGDSYLDVVERTSKFLDKLLTLKNKKVLLVSHAGTMRAILSILTEQDYKNHPPVLDTIDCPNGLVYIFNTENKSLTWMNVNSGKYGQGILRRESY